MSRKKKDCPVCRKKQAMEKNYAFEEREGYRECTEVWWECMSCGATKDGVTGEVRK